MSRSTRRGVSGPTGARHDGATKGPGWADGARRAARAGGAPQPPPVRPAVRPERGDACWLVVERGHAGSAPLILGLADGRRVLPVFGFEEEANLFARLSRRGGRGVLRIGTDELLSILCGVDLVALDPLSDAEADVLDGSSSLTRQRFLDLLIGPGNSDGPGRSLAVLAPGDPGRGGP